ncbi:hypothetical protein EIN_502080 [Entamoeba invadens IP1]|uniref:TLDc domain-containing protein n=1 Tax=Entamoeba invadens IP1 TaxID=370355 RepID=A0A0A1TUY9_ENTIV|nr:hypothetical protein EIN_502080 [Entamoeba invadens IP1]ELP84095.1 hypothetical protein EIN_502080 [Entamoeba invadens IP1]|eukprot:XP_004183441.1 hypothetical protein EIN_502080 [Entamoeba invadens IP1]
MSQTAYDFILSNCPDVNSAFNLVQKAVTEHVKTSHLVLPTNIDALDIDTAILKLHECVTTEEVSEENCLSVSRQIKKTLALLSDMTDLLNAAQKLCEKDGEDIVVFRNIVLQEIITREKRRSDEELKMNTFRKAQIRDEFESKKDRLTLLRKKSIFVENETQEHHENTQTENISEQRREMSKPFQVEIIKTSKNERTTQLEKKQKQENDEKDTDDIECSSVSDAVPHIKERQFEITQLIKENDTTEIFNQNDKNKEMEDIRKNTEKKFDQKINKNSYKNETKAKKEDDSSEIITVILQNESDQSEKEEKSEKEDEEEKEEDVSQSPDRTTRKPCMKSPKIPLLVIKGQQPGSGHKAVKVYKKTFYPKISSKNLRNYKKPEIPDKDEFPAKGEIVPDLQPEVKNSEIPIMTDAESSQIEEWSGKRVTECVFDVWRDKSKYCSKKLVSRIGECDEFVVVMSGEGSLFGVVMHEKVDRDGQYFEDKKCFLFCLRENGNVRTRKYNIKEKMSNVAFSIGKVSGRNFFEMGDGDVKMWRGRDDSKMLCKCKQNAFKYQEVGETVSGKEENEELVVERFAVFKLE